MSIVAGAVATTLRVAIGWQPMGYRLAACAPQIAFIPFEIRLSALSRSKNTPLTNMSDTLQLESSNTLI
jgi:hypothetical protein